MQKVIRSLLQRLLATAVTILLYVLIGLGEVLAFFTDFKATKNALIEANGGRS